VHAGMPASSPVAIDPDRGRAIAAAVNQAGRGTSCSSQARDTRPPR
jgi:hypothetical protein